MRLEPVLRGLLFAIAFLSLVADALAADVRTARQAVYKIGAKLHGRGAALGSAVLLAPGRLVTNCHTTRDADRILILHREGEIPARMAHMNPRQDLCLLLAPELQGPVPERRPSSQLQIGEQVIAIGYAEGYQPYISEGRITALYQMDGAYVIRTTAGFPRGASGGGLFDEQGRLVGVLTFRGTLGDDLNYAVPTEWVEPLVEADAIPHEPKAVSAAFWQDNAPAQPIFLQAAWLEKAEAWAELHGDSPRLDPRRAGRSRGMAGARAGEARAGSPRGSCSSPRKHPGMHRTETVDYAIVLEGEIYAVMDQDETLMRAGDVLIQRGTNHAWANRSDKTARIAFVLIDGKR